MRGDSAQLVLGASTPLPHQQGLKAQFHAHAQCAGRYDLSELVERVRTKIEAVAVFGCRFLMAIPDIAVFSRNVPNSAAAAWPQTPPRAA
jgi:hypothetical protein